MLFSYKNIWVVKVEVDMNRYWIYDNNWIKVGLKRLYILKF